MDKFKNAKKEVWLFTYKSHSWMHFAKLKTSFLLSFCAKKAAPYLFYCLGQWGDFLFL